MEQISKDTNEPICTDSIGDCTNEALLNLRAAAAILFEIASDENVTKGREAMGVARKMILQSYHCLNDSFENNHPDEVNSILKEGIQ